MRPGQSWRSSLAYSSQIRYGLATNSQKAAKSPRNGQKKIPAIQPSELPIKPRVVVKNSTSFASAIVRLVDDSDIDSYRKMLQTLRENPQIKNALIDTLTPRPHPQHDNLSLSTKPWFNQWVLKALKDPASPVFPLSLPSEDANDLLELKATLASLLFACRYTTDTPFRNYLLSNGTITAEPSKLEETHYRKATRLANEIGDTFSLAKLDRLIAIVRAFLAGQQSEEDLLHTILSACHLHIDKLENLFRYLEIPMSSKYIDTHTIHHIPYTIYHIPYTIYHIPYTLYH
ncbi:hypothetical protein EON63_17020, partial [archaeon]